MNYLYLMWLRTVKLRANETNNKVRINGTTNNKHQVSCGYGYNPVYHLPFDVD